MKHSISSCPSLKSALAAALVLCGTAVSSLQAGTPAAPVPPPPVTEEESIFSAELSVGYDSFYIFRGEELWEQTVWGQVEIGVALTEQLSLTLTPWYLGAVDDDYTELNLLAGLSYDAGFAEFSAGYAGYIYPRGGYGGGEGINDEHEASLGVSKTFGVLEASTLAAYNFDREGTYLQAGLGASIDLTPSVALEPSAAVGYSAGYFASDGFTHVLLTLALPVKLTERATLTPYIAGNLPLEVLEENQGEELFGGVALTVSF